MLKKLLFILCILSLSSCNVMRKVPTGDYLLRKNDIAMKYASSVKHDEKFSTSELEAFIPTSQTPNKRIVGFPFYLSAYNLIDSSKHSWFQKIFRKIGEPPAILDTLSTNNSLKEMDMYLQSQGFYSAQISDTIKYRNGRARITYKVNSGEPTIIGSIKYNFEDKTLKNIILSDSANSLIKVGQVLRRETLSQERVRIANALGNMGYYNFYTKNITYTVDTLIHREQADLTINILETVNNGVKVENEIYRIRNIYVNSNYSPSANNDTVKYDTTIYKGIYYITKNGVKQNIKPKVISEALTIYPNFIYSKEEIDYTNINLSNLRYFKNINIVFNEINADQKDEYVIFAGGSSDSAMLVKERYIDCVVECTPMLRQSYNMSGELSSNSNYTGLSVTLGYANKNLFKGADLFDVSFNTAYDIMHTKSKNNSYEFGVSLALTIPRFLTPFGIARYNRLSRTSTRFELSYNNQNRPLYHRIMSSAALAYQWSKRSNSSYIIKPFNVAYIRVPRIAQDYIDGMQNEYLRNSYTSQLIMGTYGSYIFSNQTSPKRVTHMLKINGETSGNFLDLVSVIANSPLKGQEGDRYHNAFGVRYAQYFRFDGSYVMNIKIKEAGALVFRVLAGGGYAYGNTKSLPFERMFFAGGASSMRGWQVRMLGPGNVPEPNDNYYPNQVGDIRLEANIEARFPIVGPLKGAIFMDAGNIWSNGKGEKDPAARFDFDTFAKQIALNTGVGVRFDFSFFILRLDWGIQLKNPGRTVEWIHKFDFMDTAVHFGIGYPF